MKQLLSNLAQEVKCLLRICERTSNKMVKIKSLKQTDIGKWVEYRGSGGELEKGKIKSWNDRFIFVVYKCGEQWDNFQNYTGQATKPEDLFDL